MSTESGNNHKPTSKEVAIQTMIASGYPLELYEQSSHAHPVLMYYHIYPLLDPLLMKGSVLRYPPTVIDVGAGNNEFSKNISGRYQIKTINLDLNHEVQKLHPEDTNITASLYKLPLRNESVDIIICKDVLAHVGNDHLDECFEEFDRVLKPGGSALIVFVQSSVPGVFANNTSLKPEEMTLEPRKLVSSNTVVYERTNRIHAASEEELIELTSSYFERGDKLTAPFYRLNYENVIDAVESFRFQVKETTYTQADDSEDWYTREHYQSVLQQFTHPTRHILLLTKPT